jgi:hypothetical protein
MNNKKNSLGIGIILSATILGAVFFVSATAPAFSQQNTTDLPSTNDTTTHDANNSTLHSNATEGGKGNLSHTDTSNQTVN